MTPSFERLFRKATGMEMPYGYQRALAEDEWPDVLVAPTGFGKTAAVLMSWVYKRLVAAPNTSRRLVFCLPMRTLVEQTERSARKWCRAVAEDFRSAGMAVPAAHVLLGGRVEQDWRLHPEEPAIIVGTQDMLLSRALMRGYGMSRFQWPVDFALLHSDSTWVFDEVQLMDAALPTSTQIEAFRRDQTRFKGTFFPSRTLWMSATLDTDWLKSIDFAQHAAAARVIRVTGETEQDAEYRWRAPKMLMRASFVLSKAAEKKGYAANIAAAALDAISSGKTVLVIVNRVARAQAVYAELKRRASDASPVELLLIHSRFRRTEREAQTQRLNEGSATGGRIVVSTQAIEAGVDLTSAVLFTELAPWSSLVQRFGRCNRAGEEAEARAFWIDAEDDADLARPYEIDALKVARERLSCLADVSLQSLACFSPGDLPHREVIRARDVIDLFDTDPDLSGFDVDVSRYIRTADDTDVQVFWRDMANEPDLSAIESAAEELCSVSIGRAREWLSAVEKSTERRLAFRVDPLATGGRRDKAWKPINSNRIFPGQTLLVDVVAGGYDRSLGFTGDRKHIPNIRTRNEAEIPDTVDEERLSEYRKCYVGLRQHLAHVTDEANKVCDALGIDFEVKQSIRVAAAWHDVGKAHDEFQQRMGRATYPHRLPQGDFLAKSKTYRRKTERPYFRHELASALAWIANETAVKRPDRDLIAYLIAAHHGKVRLNLRALPGEAEPADTNIRFVRGVWDGDELPAFEIPDWGPFPASTLSVAPALLGRASNGSPSWAERTRRLLDHYGPFRLAFFEALICIADWRASRAEEARGQDDV